MIEFLLKESYSVIADEVVPSFTVKTPAAWSDEWAKAHFFFGAKTSDFEARKRRKSAVFYERFRVSRVMTVDLDKIRVAADRVALSHGLEVVELEYVSAAKHRALRVFVEKNAVERAKLAEAAKLAGEQDAADEGLIPAAVAAGALSMDQLAWVTHEDCEQFSVDFGTLVDVEDLVPGAEYTLEVSSPGLERKLFHRADYERFRGSLVKIQSFQPVEGNRHWQGRLTGVGEKSITVDLSAVKQKGKNKKIAVQAVDLELANIEKSDAGSRDLISSGVGNRDWIRVARCPGLRAQSTRDYFRGLTPPASTAVLV